MLMSYNALGVPTTLSISFARPGEENLPNRKVYMKIFCEKDPPNRIFYRLRVSATIPKLNECFLTHFFPTLIFTYISGFMVADFSDFKSMI